MNLAHDFEGQGIKSERDIVDVGCVMTHLARNLLASVHHDAPYELFPFLPCFPWFLLLLLISP